MPLVERSHIYERVQLDEYNHNILLTHLDHFWNLTPLDEVSGCGHYILLISLLKSVNLFMLKYLQVSINGWPVLPVITINSLSELVVVTYFTKMGMVFRFNVCMTFGLSYNYSSNNSDLKSILLRWQNDVAYMQLLSIFWK